MVDIASLAIKIDTSDTAKAEQALDKLAKSGTKAEAAADGVAKSFDNAATSVGSTGSVAVAAAAGLEKSSAAARRQAEVMKLAGISAGQYNQAMRMLPMQLTDVVTSLASGMPLWMVAIQQGGQVRDSFGGIGNAARAVAGSISPMFLAVGGVSAALAALAVAYYEGSKESVRFNEALILTGNYAGTTSGQLAALSQQMGTLYGVTQGSAAEALAKAAETGQFTGEQLRLVAEAAEQMRVATGKSVDDTIAEFVRLGKDPVAAILDLNDKYHFLTEAQLEQIRTLRDQGREQEAVTEAMRTYADVIAERTPQITQNLGYIERGLQAIRIGAAATWDELKNIGRETTGAERVNELLERRNVLMANQGRVLMSSAQRKANQDTIDAITAEIKALQDAEVARIKAANAPKTTVDSGQARAVDSLNKSIGQQLESLKDLSAYEQALNTLRREGVDINSQSAKAVLAKAKQYDQEKSSMEAAEDAERSATQAARDAQRQMESQARQTAQLIAQQESYVASLERQAATLGMSATEAKAYELAERGLTGALQERAQAAIEAVDAADKQRDYQQLVKDLRTDEERLTDQLRERVKVLQEAKVSAEQYGDAITRATRQAIEEAPKFGGLDASVSGAAGELIKVAEAEDELNSWYTEQLDLQRAFLDEKLVNEEDYAARVAEINEQNNERLASIQSAYKVATLGVFSEVTGQAADMLKGLGDEGSAAYKALFLANKAASIAMAVINTEEAATRALTIDPTGLMSTITRSLGYASVGMMTATAIAGVAHDGLDNVPREGTWLLDKGERVVDRRTNGDLKDFLSGGGQQQQSPIQTFHMSFPGITDAREARPATAKAARQFARAAQQAKRYS